MPIINIAVYSLLLLLNLITPAIIQGEPLQLPKDALGWTVFTPSTDSRICYVSSADGDDGTATFYNASDPAIGENPFQPVGSIAAFSSYAEAYSHTRDGYPDWILLKRGDEFFFSIGWSIRNGRAAHEPFLIGTYGSAGMSPIIKTGTSSALAGRDLQYIAISGIDFYSHTRDPDSSDYIDGSGASGIRFVAGSGESIMGILIEGCKFRFYTGNSIQRYQGILAGDIDIRRTIFADNYSESSHSQGLYTSGIVGLNLEENIFIHNGWYTQQIDGGNDQAGGQATMFNHNTYFANSTNVTFSQNMFLMASSIGTKWTANDGFIAENITLDNNLFVDGEVAISLGGNTIEPLRFSNTIIQNNVITNIGRSQPTGRTLGWGIDAQDWDGGLIADNILLNQPLTVISNTYGINLIGTLRNVTITGNILHNIRFADGLNLSDARGSNVSNMVFSNNKIQISQDARYTIDTAYDPTGKWSFSNNVYYSDRADTSQFRIGGTPMSLSAWQAATGDSSIFEASSFPDPTRNIEGYQAINNNTATIDAFITSCRNQDRFSWDKRYTAYYVNKWIRAGFVSSFPWPMLIPSIVDQKHNF